MPGARTLRPIVWIGGSRADLSAFPEEVKDAAGYALYLAQQEIRTGLFTRCKLRGWVYVLHAFQKKSKRGIETPKSEIELIKSRLRRAEEDHHGRSR